MPIDASRGLGTLALTGDADTHGLLAECASSPLMWTVYRTLARVEPRNDGSLLWYDQIPPTPFAQALPLGSALFHDAVPRTAVIEAALEVVDRSPQDAERIAGNLDRWAAPRVAAALVDGAVVAATQDREVGKRRGPALRPVPDVVALADPHAAPREATPAVAMLQRPA